MDDQVVPSIGTQMSTLTAMKLAISEAKKGAPFVSPNPAVGCVVLDSKGQLLSTGHHEKYGELHAETNAIKNLSPEQLKNAHLIVTLEPCAHQGRQPSCAKTLAHLPIKKVTYGLGDPNPLVAGQGAEILRQAGIESVEIKNATDVTTDEKNKLIEDLEDVAEIYLKNFREQKTFVALKIASSLDGAIALASGESKWITGPEARYRTHYLRACYDMTLVGSGTVLMDDPSLNIREQKFTKENKVGVLDPSGEVLKKIESFNIFKTHQPESIFIFVGSSNISSSQVNHIKNLKVNVIPLKTFAWNEILMTLWAQNIKSVMVEGGGKVASSLINERQLDRLHLFQAPVLLGQKLTRGWNADLEVESMDKRPEFKAIKITQLGQDMYLTGHLKRPQIKS